MSNETTNSTTNTTADSSNLTPLDAQILVLQLELSAIDAAARDLRAGKLPTGSESDVPVVLQLDALTKQAAAQYKELEDARYLRDEWRTLERAIEAYQRAGLRLVAVTFYRRKAQELASRLYAQEERIDNTELSPANGALDSARAAFKESPAIRRLADELLAQVRAEVLETVHNNRNFSQQPRLYKPRDIRKR